MSKRVYPKRKCLHCHTDYFPHDYRQQYCSVQHRVDAGNDRRREQTRTRFNNEKPLRKTDRVLEQLEKRMNLLKMKTVTFDTLLLHGIERLDLCVELSQDRNSRIVRWFYDYGLQATNPQATEFRILKRNAS